MGLAVATVQKIWKAHGQAPHSWRAFKLSNDPARRRLKHGVFCSVTDLQATINRFVVEHNENPKPFVWRADSAEIIAARARGFQALESIH